MSDPVFFNAHHSPIGAFASLTLGSSLVNDYSGNLNGKGPAIALPRFRYNLIVNVAYADGHAKGKRKGGLSWCNEMYVQGSNVNPYSSGDRSDGYEFNAGNICAGYNAN